MSQPDETVMVVDEVIAEGQAAINQEIERIGRDMASRGIVGFRLFQRSDADSKPVRVVVHGFKDMKAAESFRV